MSLFCNDKLVENILDRARNGCPLDDSDLWTLLRIRKGHHLEALFEAARAVRDRHFGNRVFLYGFVYTSTYCRNDCTFCYYRRSNSLSVRYRKKREEILETSEQLAAAGVHLIDLTMGEDPELYGSKAQGFEELAELLALVRTSTGLPVMASTGAVPDYVLQSMVNAGVAWYACYQETHNPSLFQRLRAGQSFHRRMHKKAVARDLGLLVEEGILCGIGEKDADLIESIGAMRAMDADQVRVMTFIPQRGTPLERWMPTTPWRELVVIALLRLAFPDRLIPASLDVEGLTGLKDRLRAGANVVTSIVPPGRGLRGVAQSSLDIDESRRSVNSVQSVLMENGLEPAGLDEYLMWIENRRKSIARAASRSVTDLPFAQPCSPVGERNHDGPDCRITQI